MKIRFSINIILLNLINETRDEMGFNTSEMLNFIIDYYYKHEFGIDYLGLFDENGKYKNNISIDN